ncbi:hypothetical protein BD779DRAFT_1546833 [Infundibulicybe gibba]|nr:hypothetical protein BD779DRAFT_1546833 [Infundibulicybe gibba]
MLDIMARDDFGGAAVTMPIKSAVLSCLDVVSPESRDTGACNTVVKVPTPTGSNSWGKIRIRQQKLVLGVRNAVLHGLRAQCTWHITEESAYHAKANAAGLVIGGGATTRSAIFALGLLGVNSIFIVNRDADEARRERVFDHLRHPGDVHEHLVGPEKRRIVVAVGAIRM